MPNKQENLMDNAENAVNKHNPIAFKNSDSGDDSHLAWWQDACFGMFIHWGLYSHLGGVWGKIKSGVYAEHIQLSGKIPLKQYEKLVEEFNPHEFSAKIWVSKAVACGMKYLVFTAKHHDGFAMYDTKVNDYSIMQTPYGKDIMRELFDECRKQGVVPCVYYSHSMDWHHPDGQGNTLDYPNNIGAYGKPEEWTKCPDKSTRYERYLNELCYPQIKELLTEYGDIGIIWFDCGHKFTPAQAERMVKFCKSLQPNCLINSRVGPAKSDYENFTDNQVAYIPSEKNWETIATTNDSWGFRYSDKRFKSMDYIMHLLVGAVAAGGNFMLNIGPKGDGTFDSGSDKILEKLAQWMGKNNTSITSTTASPIGKPSFGYCTHKQAENKLFLHVMAYPKNGRLLVPGIKNNITKAYFLADDSQKIQIEKISEKDWAFHIPKTPIDDVNSVIVVEYEGDLDACETRLLMDNLPNKFHAFDGKISGKTLRLDNGKEFHDCTADWASLDDSIEWQLRLNETGEYKLEIEYKNDFGKGGCFDIVLEGEGHTVTKRARVRLFKPKYSKKYCGTVTLAAGEYTVKIKPKKIKWGFGKGELIKLRNLVFTSSKL